MTEPRAVLGLLPAYLVAQRWFGGKGREFRIGGVRWIPVREELPALWHALVQVRYTDAETETYQVVVGLRAVDDLPERFLHGQDPARLGVIEREARSLLAYDAVADPELTRLWLPRAGIESDQPGYPLGADQSNSSVVYGDARILKLYRRVLPGAHPEVEVTTALTAFGSEVVAPVLGTIADGSTALALVQPFYKNGSEGWAVAQASVRSRLADPEIPADEDGGDFSGEAERLGATTARMHDDLARALPTGEASVEQVRATAAQLHERLSMALAATAELEPYRDRVRAAYDRVAALTRPVPVQRVHGDYHLGQLLRVDDGWRVLDFEGEPARPLEERRALMSPLRDVAGMLRSLDYAARRLLLDLPDADRLEGPALEWVDRNRDAFCDGYAKTAGHDPRDDGVLLTAFELDKAVYEVLYEARNRPAWIGIPLAGIARLVS